MRYTQAGPAFGTKIKTAFTQVTLQLSEINLRDFLFAVRTDRIYIFSLLKSYHNYILR